MGWQIKHNKKGYQIISTVSDERIHEKKWLTKDETKAVMAEVALYDFYEKLIKIDKDFLCGYNINDKRVINDPKHGSFTANSWMIDNNDKIESEGKNILSRLLAIKIE